MISAAWSPVSSTSQILPGDFSAPPPAVDTTAADEVDDPPNPLSFPTPAESLGAMAADGLLPILSPFPRLEKATFLINGMRERKVCSQSGPHRPHGPRVGDGKVAKE